jgi:hypothetical protein
MAHEVKCADTVSILTEWNETLSTYRMTATYDAAGIAAESWTLVEAFVGDWQPVSGATLRAEAGLSVRTMSVVLGPCNLDVEENDRVQKADGTFQYVDFVQEFEDHTTIHLKRDKGSQ